MRKPLRQIASAYPNAHCAIMRVMLWRSALIALACIAVAGLGTVLLALVYRREVRQAAPSSGSRASATSIVSNLADQEC